MKRKIFFEDSLTTKKIKISNASLDNTNDHELGEFLQGLPAVVSSKILKWLDYDAISYLQDNCVSNYSVFKNSVSEHTKINGIVPELRKQFFTKIGFYNKLISLTTFNLEFTFVDLRAHEFITLFTHFLLQRYDFIEYKLGSKTSYYTLQLKSQQNKPIPLAIQLNWAGKDGVSSLSFADTLDKMIHHKSNDQIFHDGFKSLVINSVNGTPHNLGLCGSILKGYIGLTTTPEYFGIVDDFVTKFRSFFNKIYEFKQAKLNRIISCKHFRNQFKSQSTEFWTKLSSVYKMDFEPRMAMARRAVATKEISNSEFFDRKVMVFSQSNVCCSLILKLFNPRRFQCFSTHLSCKDREIKYFLPICYPACYYFSKTVYSNRSLKNLVERLCKWTKALSVAALSNELNIFFSSL